jgi:peroxin-1
VEVPALDAEGREDVMVQVMKRRGVRERKRGVVRRVAERMEGYRGRDVDQIITRAIHAAITRRWIPTTGEGREENEGQGGGDRGALSLTSDDFTAALEGFVPSNLKSIIPPSSASLDWAHIGGYEEVKRMLTDTLKLPTEYGPLFSRLPLKLRSGLLLYGPPGCGK